MDPYEVLGVNRGADEETIKKAYKALVKKYHPDKYINSPMADVASEKMKEINRAYDMITKPDKGAGSNPYASGGYNPYGRGYGTGGYNPYGRGYGGYSSAQPSFQNVRLLIQFGRLAEAQQMLNSLQQTAEWYYLYGIICQRRGWYDKAAEYLKKAVDMEPGNAEYRAAFDNMNDRNTAYTGTFYGNSSNCLSNCCALCLCLQCCNPMPCC